MIIAAAAVLLLQATMASPQVLPPSASSALASAVSAATATVRTSSRSASTTTSSASSSSSTTVPSISGSTNPLASLSSACQAAIAAANVSANAACPNLSTMNAQPPKFETMIMAMCSDSSCQKQLNDMADIFINGACSQDSLSVPGVSTGSGSQFSFKLSLTGYFVKASQAILCQKTSDNKGYCATSQTNSSYASLATIAYSSILSASFNSSSSASSSPMSMATLGLFQNKTAVCTDCTKNGLAAVVAVPNLPSELQSAYQNISNQFNTFCGNNLTVITGSGGLTNSAMLNGASLALFMSTLVVVLGFI